MTKEGKMLEKQFIVFFDKDFKMTLFVLDHASLDWPLIYYLFLLLITYYFLLFITLIT